METIGKYEVLEKIGEGGFGVIYKGRDPHIRRLVAIKTCTSQDSRIRGRFTQEAHIAGNLHHRRIVIVYDFGLEEGVPYLVQEYLSGEDLDRKIERQDYIPFPEKLLYLVQIARGLDYAHRRDVIHRDIKPANIRILDDGSVKIMDFGIAKLADQETGLTQTGMTLGTAAYLAPEQVRGETVDARTDIFSYGVLAYELITHRRPFAGNHISNVLYQVLNEDPPPVRSFVPDCPEGVAALVERCLSKNPNDRYPDCTAILDELEQSLERRREDRSASTSGEDDGGLMATAELDAQPAAVADDSPPPGDVPGPALFDVEYQGTDDETRTPHSISSTQSLRRRDLRLRGWVALVVAAALAVGGWFYWTDRPPDTELASADGETTREAVLPPDVKTSSEAESDAPTPESAEDTAETTPASTAAETTGASDEEPATPAGETSADADADTADSDEQVEPQSEPPPPADGVLLLPAAGPELSVRINNGPTIELAESRRIELAPGRYRLDFAYIDGRYRDYATSTVELDSDQRQRVIVPLYPPGELTVQAQLGTPQGLVAIDGEIVGRSPISGHRVSPGSHEVRVTGTDGEASVVESVDVGSEERTVVTFDLGARRAVVR